MRGVLKVTLICCIYSIPKASCKYSVFLGSLAVRSGQVATPFMRPFLGAILVISLLPFEALAPSEMSQSAAKVVSTER